MKRINGLLIVFLFIIELIYSIGIVFDNRIIEKVIVMSSIIVSMIMMLRNRKSILRKEMPFVFFVLAYVITVLINARVGIAVNMKALIWICFNLFVLFNFSILCNSEAFDIIRLLVTVYTTVVSLIAIVLAIVDLGISIQLADGSDVLWGAMHGRVWCPGSNSYCTLSLICLIWSFEKMNQNEFRLKTLYILSFAIQYIYILISGFNTQKWTLCLLIIGYSILYFRKKEFKKGLFRIVVCMLSMFSLIVVSSKFFSISGKIISDTKKIKVATSACNKLGIDRYILSSNNSDFVFDTYNYDEKIVVYKSSSDAVLDRRKITDTTSLSIRFSAWRDGMYIFKDHWLWGIGANSGYIYAQDYLDKEFSWFKNEGEYSTHNAWLDILLSSGGLGFCVFMWGMIMSLGKKLNLTFTKIVYKRCDIIDLEFLACFFVFFMTGLMFPMMLYGVGMVNILLWGYLSFYREDIDTNYDLCDIH